MLAGYSKIICDMLLQLFKFDMLQVFFTVFNLDCCHVR